MNLREYWQSNRDNPEALMPVGIYLFNESPFLGWLKSEVERLRHIADIGAEVVAQNNPLDLSNQELIAEYRHAMSLELVNIYLDEIAEWQKRMQPIAPPIEGMPIWIHGLIFWLIDIAMSKDTRNEKLTDFFIGLALTYHRSTALGKEMVRRGLQVPLVRGIVFKDLELIVQAFDTNLYSWVYLRPEELSLTSQRAQAEINAKLDGVWASAEIWNRKDFVDVFEAGVDGDEHLLRYLEKAAKSRVLNYLDSEERQTSFKLRDEGSGLGEDSNERIPFESLDQLLARLEDGELDHHTAKRLQLDNEILPSGMGQCVCEQCMEALTPAEKRAVFDVQGAIEKGYAFSSKIGGSMEQAFGTKYEATMRNWRRAKAKLQGCTHRS